MNPNHKLCTFWVGDSLFGINTEFVQEVCRNCAYTPVPGSPDYILGLMNLRGQIVTVIDLELKLELRGNSENNPENNTHIIIRHDGELHSICARKVGDMVEVPSQSMEKEPGHLDPSLKRVLDGLFRFNDHVLHCLNLSQLLKTKDTAREQS